MNFRNILSEIEHADPEVYKQVSDRRHILKSIGTKAAVAALPFAITALFPKKATARTTAGASVTDSLNFVLELAYFQYNFYHSANHTGGLIPFSSSNVMGVNDLPGFQAIEANELAHILFLNTAITSLGAAPYTPNGYSATDLEPQYIPTDYDFTQGSTYNTFSDYATFLILAQTFQDTFVRAIKSMIPNVVSNTTVLTQLMQIHSMEARSAAHVRTVRRYTGAPEIPAPWITNDIAPVTNVQSSYNGEANLMQSGININELPDIMDNSGVVPKISATAAFDESIDYTVVSKFIAQFMVQ